MSSNQSSIEIWSQIPSCRICDSAKLSDVLDLSTQPPANSLRANLSDPLTDVPLKIVQCDACSTVQLTATIDPEYLFSNYVWVTATSATANSYSEYFCNELLNRIPNKTPFVVEVASNDGTFLKQFKKKGCEILGVDPAKNIAAEAVKDGVPTMAEFFNAEIADTIINTYSKKPDLIFARNVMPHVKEIHSIVEGFSKLANDESTLVIEFHYAKVIVDELHYDSIYHEHLFFFSLKSFSFLFERYGFFPYDVFKSPISGGSLVLFFSKQKKEITDALKEAYKIENDSKLNDLATWVDFGEKSIAHAKELKAIVKEYAKTEKLAAYGASARSSTMLNFAEINSNDIEFVVDQNPLKAGLLTPGTDIPIHPLKDIKERLFKKPALLLLAWNFENEIVNDLRAAGFEGAIIVPLPNKIHIR
jgi:hypothetical protein